MHDIAADVPVSARAWRGHNGMLALRHGPPVLFDGDPGLGRADGPHASTAT